MKMENEAEYIPSFVNEAESRERSKWEYVYQANSTETPDAEFARCANRSNREANKRIKEIHIGEEIHYEMNDSHPVKSLGKYITMLYG